MIFVQVQDIVSDYETPKTLTGYPPFDKNLVVKNCTDSNIDNEWDVIFSKFNDKRAKENCTIESLCTLGNGKMGQRGSFEEKFTGKTQTANTISNIWYPDKTRVGWWKNGYPPFYPKNVITPNWLPIYVTLNGIELDLHDDKNFKISNFKRILHLKTGALERKCTITSTQPQGGSLELTSFRFISKSNKNLGVIKYSLKSINFEGKIELKPGIDGDVENEEIFWQHDKKWVSSIKKTSYDESKNEGFIWVHTKKPLAESKFEPLFHIVAGMKCEVKVNNKKIIEPKSKKYDHHDSQLFLNYEYNIKKGEEISVNKYSVINYNLEPQEEKELIKANNYREGKKNVDIEIDMNKIISNLLPKNRKMINEAFNKGFDKLLKEHSEKWNQFWEKHDIIIEGDQSAQQGIRFALFHTHASSMYEEDYLAKVTPKGFTGEKYGNGNYWDVDAFCLQYFLVSNPKIISEKIVNARLLELPNAIINAKTLGYENGAAFYPMVSMLGQECHNEWEITFEEIHRNGAIIRGLYDYIQFTNDWDILLRTDIAEVPLRISKFWSQRVQFSKSKGKYVMLGVTGPNEFENNVNNNYYTSKLCTWSMEYSQEILEFIKKNNEKKYKKLMDIVGEKEIEKWNDIIKNMYYPKDEKANVYLQNDGFEDKDFSVPVTKLKMDNRPLWRVWSWDRILRSVYIKQADTLQGTWYFDKDPESIERHFNYYEPYTVHESSLSACLYSILALKVQNYYLNKLKNEKDQDKIKEYKEKVDKFGKKGYELGIIAMRYSLDNYNFDTVDGAHITSMFGALLNIIWGFAGISSKDGVFEFNPTLPKSWKSLQFSFFDHIKNKRFNFKHSNGKTEIKPF